MKKISDEILIFQLGERYSAMQVIRTRAQNISIWLLGIFTTGSGYLAQAKINLNDWQKLFLSAIVVVFYILIRFYFLNDLERGFKSQQKVAVGIEKKLGLYESSSPILPSEWKNSGGKRSSGNYFNSIYIMIGLGVIIILSGILLQGKL